MAELIAVTFDNRDEAGRVLDTLARLQKEYLIDLEDAVIAVRDEDGKVRLKQSIPLVGLGAASGGSWGMLWGTLIGMLVLNPLAGLVTGGLLGAGAGALAGSLSDYGIDDNFIRSLGESFPPNGSALFLLVRKAQPEKVMDELRGFNGKVLRTSLSKEQEERLQQAIKASQG